MKRKVKVLHGPLLRKELENDRHHLKKAFSAKFEELCAGEPRFSVEACEFILMAVSHAARKDTTFQRKCGLNLTARELVKTCEEYARDTFGPSAKGTLKSWGLETSSDIGHLVFLLVENRILGKREDERRKDFDQLPFLND